MKSFSIQEAETQLASLVKLAASGEEIVILQAGVPAVQLLALKLPAKSRRFGTLKGKIRVSDDFDSPLPEAILGAFEGR